MISFDTFVRGKRFIFHKLATKVIAQKIYSYRHCPIA